MDAPSVVSIEDLVADERLEARHEADFADSSSAWDRNRQGHERVVCR